MQLIVAQSLLEAYGLSVIETPPAVDGAVPVLWFVKFFQS